MEREQSSKQPIAAKLFAGVSEIVAGAPIIRAEIEELREYIFTIEQMDEIRAVCDKYGLPAPLAGEVILAVSHPESESDDEMLARSEFASIDLEDEYTVTSYQIIVKQDGSYMMEKSIEVGNWPHRNLSPEEAKRSLDRKIAYSAMKQQDPEYMHHAFLDFEESLRLESAIGGEMTTDDELAALQEIIDTLLNKK